MLPGFNPGVMLLADETMEDPGLEVWEVKEDRSKLEDAKLLNKEGKPARWLVVSSEFVLVEFLLPSRLLTVLAEVPKFKLLLAKLNKSWRLAGVAEVFSSNLGSLLGRNKLSKSGSFFESKVHEICRLRLFELSGIVLGEAKESRADCMFCILEKTAEKFRLAS